MADKLLIVLLNADPENADEISPVFFQATVAAAMEFDVEIVFTGKTGKLAVKGEAEKIKVNDETDKTLHDLIKDASEAGAVIKVCAPSLQLWGDDLIAEIDETIGSAYVIGEAMDNDTVTFTY